jgi:hypothetical protein
MQFLGAGKKEKYMWSGSYRPLSRLQMRDNKVAELAWREGKLYFAMSPACCADYRCDDHAVEVATVEDAPQQETQILESARANKVYIMSGERTFCSLTGGESWEEI